MSEYKGSVGTVWTYNAGVDWAPVRDIRFRGNYGRAVRAPNVSETGFPVVANFAPGLQRPVLVQQHRQQPDRPPNCTADLGGLLAGLPNRDAVVADPQRQQPEPEAGGVDSLTLGGVCSRGFIPGLSLSVDYYNIKVDNVIVSLSAQAIVNGCYDQPSLNNPLCGLFTRFRGPGTGPLGELPGQILGNSLISAGQNFAKRVRRGIDTQIAYRARLAPRVVAGYELAVGAHAPVQQLRESVAPELRKPNPERDRRSEG